MGKTKNKDVWTALRLELARWKGRLTFCHVESHTDEKKDKEGNAREVTPIEEMNQYADWLADWANEAPITELKAATLESDGLPSIHMGTRMITGNWRNQIQEIRLNISKRLAEKDADSWGMCLEDIAWHRMLGTANTDSIYNRIKMAQIMQNQPSAARPSAAPPAHLEKKVNEKCIFPYCLSAFSLLNFRRAHDT